MVEQSLNLQLSVSPQSKHTMLKGFNDLFDCQQVRLCIGSLFFLDLSVFGSHHHAIGSLSNWIDYLVSLVNFEDSPQDEESVRGLVWIIIILLNYFRLFILFFFHFLFSNSLLITIFFMIIICKYI